MPLPFIPVVSALAAGGSLVPHAAGGMIVTSATGYVAGTYLSTSAIAGIVAATTSVIGAGALYVTGTAGKLIGGPGVFGTTMGATGVTGMLMSAGVLPSTPIWVPVAIGGAALTGTCALGYGAYRLYKLQRKTRLSTPDGEVVFTEEEAQLVEKLIRRFGKP